MTPFMKRAAAAAVLIAALPFSAEAFPIATAPAAQADAGITLVSGGCGPGFHRGPLLGCRANRVVVLGPVMRRPFCRTVLLPLPHRVCR